MAAVANATGLTPAPGGLAFPPAAKRDLAAGETLDGEGGYLVYGKLAPARDARAIGALPIGLAHGVRLRARVAAHAPVRWADVEIDEAAEAVRMRRALEHAPPGTRG